MKLNLFKKDPPPYLEEDLNAPEVWFEGTPREQMRSPERDDGTMVANVWSLNQEVVGQRIVKAEREKVPSRFGYTDTTKPAMVLTLDNGKRVILRDTYDCCALTVLEDFLLHPESVDHIIMGVGTTDLYTTWHIYADYGDILNLQVDWSCGNPFYYGYGFDIEVVDV